MKAGKQNFNLQVAITFVGVALFITKLIAWRLTHSVSILTDALESTINVAAGFIGLYSLYLSNQPKDINHPYGHGKVEFLSAGIEGTLICLAGLGIIYQAIVNLLHPPVISKIDTGIILISATAVINYAMGFIAVKLGNRNKSVALIASGKHLKTDTYSTIGIVIGLYLITMTGLQWIDSISALFFGGVVLITSFRILRGSIAGIMDEADHELLREIVEYINHHRRDNWLDLHNLRIIKYGRILHIDAHMTVPWHLNVQEAHAELKLIEAIMQEKYGQNIEMFIHLDPSDKDFEPSKAPQTEWTVANVTQRHSSLNK